MPFKFDYTEDAVLEWELTETGVTVTENSAYSPCFYVESSETAGLTQVAEFCARHPVVTDIAIEEWRPSWRRDYEQLLAISVDHIDELTGVVFDIKNLELPGEYRFYNVDFSREFRYALETNTNPVPSGELETLSLCIPERELATRPIETLTIDGTTHTGEEETVLHAVTSALESRDPDVLIINQATVVPTLFDIAEDSASDFQLGRRPGYQQLAQRSTYESYGRIGHSPARYDVPGRVLIDQSNTFFLNETNLEGCIDIVRRSWKPLQEASWASIGNALTAIQIREAIDRDVLVPWKSWRPEFFKTMRQLHESDRGGYIFAPEVGVHTDVHELDFSSLYPNIIRTRNISPETIRCDCHADREDVPGLGYSICDKPGYLPDVLGPIIDDRKEIKDEIKATDDPDRQAKLQGQSDALKWILVSCFGYQGFSNAKFGRIENHEAINAFAREILLDAKETLESNGWRVVHGIVDSIWVTPMEDAEQTDLQVLADRITEAVQIELEYEAEFDWVAFVPMRDSEAGALTKYFGKYQGEDEYKFRGIEARQRSTPAFIVSAQESLIETFDRTRDPEAVCEHLEEWLNQLRSGEVDPTELVIKKRVSKNVDEYSQYTQNVAALERAEIQGIEKHPGQNVKYVVVDDAKQSADRVLLADEVTPSSPYDAEFYSTLLIRAATSVLSPLGWHEEEIRAAISDHSEAGISQYA